MVGKQHTWEPPYGTRNTSIWCKNYIRPGHMAEKWATLHACHHSLGRMTLWAILLCYQIHAAARQAIANVGDCIKNNYKRFTPTQWRHCMCLPYGEMDGCIYDIFWWLRSKFVRNFTSSMCPVSKREVPKNPIERGLEARFGRGWQGGSKICPYFLDSVGRYLFHRGLPRVIWSHRPQI